jgi:tripartite ATP-independent transporter DctP family solute receptor
MPRIEVTRRNILAAGAALPLVAIRTRPASAAQFTYKLATGQEPSHPVNVRAQQAIDKIKEKTSGDLVIQLFPAAQLGTDAQLIAQARLGGVQFINMAASVLATFVPAAGIVNVGFAFPGYDNVWKAMDGALGKFVSDNIARTEVFLVGRSWDNGFRQITSSAKGINNPDDLKGFKIRVPNAPLLTSLFSSLGAAPTAIDFSEVYTALQTHLVDGQENPLPIIATAKLNEVQKFCSMTNHVWDGYFILGNKAAFGRLPKPMQDAVTEEFNAAGLAERDDIAKLSSSLQATLKNAGMTIVDPDKPAFRATVGKTDFYPSWHKKFGDEGWGLLEGAVGKLG